MHGPAPTPVRAQVSSGLNLVLPLRTPVGADDRPRKLAELMAYLEERRPATTKALRRLNFVHFARFLPAADGSTLSVITEFDGPLQPYVMDFIIVVGDEFSKILSYMEGWPAPTNGKLVKVSDCPEKYWDYIQRHNRVTVDGLPPFENLNLFSAYPERTVLDIVGPATEPAPAPIPSEQKEGAIALSDVQANLLRGVGARRGLHLALEVGDAAAARRFLADVTGGGTSIPQVSDAERRAEGARPDYHLTVGFTHAGLAALGVDAADLAKFPQAFREGPAHWTRAAALGDRGASGPEHWVLGGPGQAVHMLVSLYGYDDGASDVAWRATAAALKGSLPGYRLPVLDEKDVWTAADRREHFGYVDGISQPRVAGLPVSGSAADDVQPQARAGEFLLGEKYTSIYGGKSIGELPTALCTNASYAVVRVLKQDVAAFERLLLDGARATGQAPEWVAARLMGRWQDGTPLTPPAAPPSGTAPGPGPTNTFDYAPSARFPALANDHQGLVCPVGAHARRMNPRHARVSGEPHSHRVMRRGMLYGPTRAEDPSLGKERGVYGMFVCADIERQFEFLQQVWANGDIAASGIRGTQDPIAGAQDLNGASGVGPFRIPTPVGDLTLQVPRLVTTRGSLYLLMPGLAGLRHLAALRPAPSKSAPAADKPQRSVHAWLKDRPEPGSARLNKSSFNPKDPAFTANPYPFYELFREQAPVLPVSYGPYSSLWVFGHKLVDRVCNGRNAKGELLFGKPSQPARRLNRDPRDEPEARGLFYMDPPLHPRARERLEPAVATHFVNAETNARNFARKQLAALALDAGSTFDVVARYTRPVTRDTLMSGLGISNDKTETPGVHLWERVGKLAERMLEHFDPMQPIQTQAEQMKAGSALGKDLMKEAMKCPVGANPSGLWCDMAKGGVTVGSPPLNLPPNPMNSNDRTILFTAANFVLAGFLSVDFMLGNALALLLGDNGSGMKAYRDADHAGRARILAEVQRFDPPFQLADRVANESTKLGDEWIPKGTLVTVCYGSANHDPYQFPNPGRFDITRVIDPKKNWVFGLDHHRCIGRYVAEVVTQVVLDELVAAFPRLALDPNQPPRRLTDAYVRGFASLPLRV